MAKIKLGALAQDVRGSVAGTTFSRNRYGSIARQKVSPVQPRTTRQLAQRAIFTSGSQAWRTLTALVMGQWATFAANHPIVDVFGDAQTLSANAAYTRIYANAVTGGLPAPTDPPVDVTPGPLMTSAPAVGSTGIVTVTFTDNPVVDDVYLVYTTHGKSPGASFVNSDYRLAGVIVGAATTLTYAVTPTDLNPLLGFAADQKVGVRVVGIGQTGLAQPASAVVVVAS